MGNKQPELVAVCKERGIDEEGTACEAASASLSACGSASSVASGLHTRRSLGVVRLGYAYAR